MNEQVTTRQRRRYSAAERARWVKQYERSGKRIGEFCAEQGLIQSNLSRWLRHHRGVAQSGQHSGSLVEVGIGAAAAPAGAAAVARVLLPGAVMMEVTSGADARWLACVLRALQSGQG